MQNTTNNAKPAVLSRSLKKKNGNQVREIKQKRKRKITRVKEKENRNEREKNRGNRMRPIKNIVSVVDDAFATE